MATDSEEIRQQVRSREGHSVTAYKLRIRNYRRQIRETQAVLQRTHAAWKAAWEENQRIRDAAGMHPWYPFENKEEHAKWRETHWKTKQQAYVRIPCDRHHFSVTLIFACILFGGICVLAGYVVGRLHV
jgi:hypothetical protein